MLTTIINTINEKKKTGTEHLPITRHDVKFRLFIPAKGVLKE